MTRVRRLLSAIFVLVLIVTLASFDRLGGDCGDSFNADGAEQFSCNPAAYLIMATVVLAALGLVAMVLWAAIDWLIARREPE